MDLDTLLTSLGTNFEIDPLTGVTLDNGFIAVEADPFDSLNVSVLDSEVVDVDLTEGVAVDVDSDLVTLDLTEGVAVSVDSDLVTLDLSEGVVVGVDGNVVEVDLSEGLALDISDFTDLGFSLNSIEI
jgi:hypothetical protein